MVLYRKFEVFIIKVVTIRYNGSMNIPLMLAPMAELSHRALRELIESFGGADLYYTEMIAAGALTSGGQFESFYTDGGPCPERLVYQLCGGNGEQLARGAALLGELPCAGIDINMGCCAPAITRTGAGIRWMASADAACSMIAAVRKALHRGSNEQGLNGPRLSVKLRIGFGDDPEYLITFCRRLEAEGVDRITLHPRTAHEKFKRRARWEYVAGLQAALTIPVTGNGDISGPEDLARRTAECPGGVMTGRAAIRQPWIFAAARGLSQTIDLEATGLYFLELLERYQPPEFHISRARRFFNYFCDNLTWAHYVKTKLNRETTLKGIAECWSTYFCEQQEERFKHG
ncbi:tRNA-dihydrouridine synthase [Spirochaetia bacterium]|nr:tRNA-dihydrouridine synthase [Spirochaetia bacterium]